MALPSTVLVGAQCLARVNEPDAARRQIRREQRDAHPDEQSDPCEAGQVLEHHHDESAGRRAKRETHAEFAPTLNDEIRCLSWPPERLYRERPGSWREEPSRRTKPLCVPLRLRVSAVSSSPCS